MKKIVSGLLIVVLAAVIIVAINYKPSQKTLVSNEEPLVTALKSTGAQNQEMSVNGWAALSEKSLTEEEMKNIVSKAMIQLGIKGGMYKLSTNADEYHQMVRAEASQDYFHAVVVCQKFYNRSKGNAEIYMVVNIETVQQEPSVANWRKMISNIFTEVGGSPRITTCLVGWFDGKLSEDEWGKKLTTAFDCIQAKASDKINNAHFASYSGYTPYIQESMTVGDSEVNVQMVMRYSQYDNRTYVIIGSPVITREY